MNGIKNDYIQPPSNVGFSFNTVRSAIVGTGIAALLFCGVKELCEAWPSIEHGAEKAKSYQNQASAKTEAVKKTSVSYNMR